MFTHLPSSRDAGIATLFSGERVNEKRLSEYGKFLTLRERVEYRKRVLALSSRVLSFPRWDLDGPDLRYFGEWNPPESSIHAPTCIRAGPWVLDGRQLVADAKDTAIMLIEAVVRMGGNRTLLIQSGWPSEFFGLRGWSFGSGPRSAWWSGVRKAVDVAGDLLRTYNIRVCALETDGKNPYEGLTSASTTIEFQSSVTEEQFSDPSVIVAVPCDPFAIVGSTLLESHMNVKPVFASAACMSVLYRGAVLQTSYAPWFRNKQWNPRARLNLLDGIAKPSTKQNTRCRSPHRRARSTGQS